MKGDPGTFIQGSTVSVSADAASVKAMPPAAAPAVKNTRRSISPFPATWPARAMAASAMRRFMIVPAQEVSLLDHLVSAAEQRDRERKSHRPCGLHVDDQLDLHCLLDWTIGRLGSLENPTGIDADETIGVSENRAVAHQATGRGKIAPLVDRRHRMACGEPDDLVGPAIEEWIALDEQRPSLLLGDGRECIVKFGFAAGLDDEKLLPRGNGGRLHVPRIRFGDRFLRVDQECNLRGGRN